MRENNEYTPLCLVGEWWKIFWYPRRIICLIPERNNTSTFNPDIVFNNATSRNIKDFGNNLDLSWGFHAFKFHKKYLVGITLLSSFTIKDDWNRSHHSHEFDETNLLNNSPKSELSAKGTGIMDLSSWGIKMIPNITYSWHSISIINAANLTYEGAYKIYCEITWYLYFEVASISSWILAIDNQSLDNKTYLYM